MSHATSQETVDLRSPVLQKRLSASLPGESSSLVSWKGWAAICGPIFLRSVLVGVERFLSIGVGLGFFLIKRGAGQKTSISGFRGERPGTFSGLVKNRQSISIKLQLLITPYFLLKRVLLSCTQKEDYEGKCFQNCVCVLSSWLWLLFVLTGALVYLAACFSHLKNMGWRFFLFHPGYAFENNTIPGSTSRLI